MGVPATALQVATEAVRESGEALATLARRLDAFEISDRAATMQEAVLASEMAIIGRIKHAFPEHGILSEELGEIRQTSGYRWIVDPLDGTVNFSRAITEYCISVALERRGTIILGLLHDPAVGHVWLAEKDQGVTRDDVPVAASTVTDLSDMLLATDNSLNRKARQSNFETLAKICNQVRHVRIMGSGALHLARIANGEIDAYFKTKFNYWDYAAGILMVKEAGGSVTDFQGKPLTGASKSIVASNGKAHRELLAALNE